MSLLLTFKEMDDRKFDFVRIVGLQTTGTNLMDKFISTNFHAKSLSIGGWKHNIFSPEYLAKHYNLHNKNVLKIVMVKHPLFWVQSMSKASYEVKFRDTDPSNQARNLNLIVTSKLVVLRDSKTQKALWRYDNICKLWNTFYSYAFAYAPQDSTIFIRYEDLLNHPEQIFEELGKYLNAKSDIVQIMDKPAKNHGKSRNRKDAMSHYNNPDNMYLGFTNSNIEFIKKYISSKILDAFSYGW
jgi:hypothetical protein